MGFQSPVRLDAAHIPSPTGMTTQEAREALRAWFRATFERSDVSITAVAEQLYGEGKPAKDPQQRRTWSADFHRFLTGHRTASRTWRTFLANMIADPAEAQAARELVLAASKRLPFHCPSRKGARTKLQTKLGDDAVALLRQMATGTDLATVKAQAEQLLSMLGLAAHLE